MRIALAGAGGLLGTALADALRARGDEVRPLRRGVGGERELSPIDGADAVVNLAGEPVDQRWTRSAKVRIRSSRIDGTREIVRAIETAATRPAVLVNASAVGYYGDRGEQEIDETSTPGEDFLAGVCTEWEAIAREAEALGVRTVMLRTGIVLARQGGLLKTLLLPARLGLAGPVAGGRQWTPWIHIADEVGLILFALDTEAAGGPLNLSAPSPERNRDLMKALGRVLHRPAIVPVPKLALRLLKGELAEAAAGSQRALPRRAQELGYEFRFPQLEPALRDLLA